MSSITISKENEIVTNIIDLLERHKMQSSIDLRAPFSYNIIPIIIGIMSLLL